MSDGRAFEHLQLDTNGMVDAARVDVSYVDPEDISRTKTFWFDSETLSDADESARLIFAGLQKDGYRDAHVTDVR